MAQSGVALTSSETSGLFMNVNVQPRRAETAFGPVFEVLDRDNRCPLCDGGFVLDEVIDLRVVARVNERRSMVIAMTHRECPEKAREPGCYCKPGYTCQSHLNGR